MRLLVICAHPDDETLGCGGTLLKHGDAGDELHWIIATKAVEPKWCAEVIERKEKEIAAVTDAYGMAGVERLGFESARLSMAEEADVIDSLGAAISGIQPETVYCVHGGDAHSDHRRLFDAVVAVLKPAYMAGHGVRRFLSFETLSSTEAAPAGGAASFQPTVFIDISDLIERKLEVMALYESEAQPEPLPRAPSSIRALARYRGCGSGVAYAEAFQLHREVG